MFTASAFIRPSRVFMVKSRVKSTVQTINLNCLKTTRFRWLQQCAQQGSPNVWQGTNSPSRVHICQRWIPIQSWQPSKRTQVISHRSVWNLRTLWFLGGIFPEPYPEAWDWTIAGKDPLFHSAFFWSKKNLKILIIHRYQQLTSSQPNTSPNWFPEKTPWALDGLWYVESANSMTVAKSTSKATKNLSSKTPVRRLPTTSGKHPAQRRPVHPKDWGLGNMFKASTTCSAHSFWFHTSRKTNRVVCWSTANSQKREWKNHQKNIYNYTEAKFLMGLKTEKANLSSPFFWIYRW